MEFEDGAVEQRSRYVGDDLDFELTDDVGRVLSAFWHSTESLERSGYWNALDDPAGPVHTRAILSEAGFIWTENDVDDAAFARTFAPPFGSVTYIASARAGIRKSYGKHYRWIDIQGSSDPAAVLDIVNILAEQVHDDDLRVRAWIPARKRHPEQIIYKGRLGGFRHQDRVVS